MAEPYLIYVATENAKMYVFGFAVSLLTKVISRKLSINQTAIDKTLVLSTIAIAAIGDILTNKIIDDAGLFGGVATGWYAARALTHQKPFNKNLEETLSKPT